MSTIQKKMSQKDINREIWQKRFKPKKRNKGRTEMRDTGDNHEIYHIIIQTIN